MEQRGNPTLKEKASAPNGAEGERKGAEGERIVEARVRPNVIRRRRERVETGAEVSHSAPPTERATSAAADSRSPAVPPAAPAAPALAAPGTSEAGNRVSALPRAAEPTRQAAPVTPAAAPARRGPRKVIQRAPETARLARRFAPLSPRLLRRRPAPGRVQATTEVTVPAPHKRVVRMAEMITAGDLARSMGIKAAEVVRKLLELGVAGAVTHPLDLDHASVIAAEFGYTVESVAFDAEAATRVTGPEVGAEALPRAPVVTVLGHVDHGKTSLLDAMRSTRVAEGEAGGITQHIGAYSVEVGGRHVTFLDTPGHEAFSSMRARGAQVTDVAILVVAADDGVKPQTVEAIAHARAAGVPIIVAVNKIDRPDASLERVKREAAGQGLIPEEWGGETIFVPVSARTREGLGQLLDALLLQADVLDLTARVSGRARGTIIEARLDRACGPVATVLVQEGTLKLGDAFVCGMQCGRVRAMLDERGQRLDAAGPAIPVEILGLSGVAEAGDSFVVTADEATARQVADYRRRERRREVGRPAVISLEELRARREQAAARELTVLLKTDVQGSIDALRGALLRLSTPQARLAILHAAVGGVTESDVLLAAASEALVIGFNVRVEPNARQLAEREGVEVRLYRVIYDAIDDVRRALEGLLEPAVRERRLGRAEVKQVFAAGSLGAVAGALVTDGRVTLAARARLIRDHTVVREARVTSLRRFKDDVREVATGLECGIGLEGGVDVRPGDVIETYELEMVPRRLDDPRRA